MAFIDWLATLKKGDVTAVTAVQAPIYVGLKGNGMKAADVTAVIDHNITEVRVTAATSSKVHPLPLEAAWMLGRTSVTSVTAEKLDVHEQSAEAANDRYIAANVESQAPYWPHTQHANDSEIDTFEARLLLFTRRGMCEAGTEMLADKLLKRDRTKDERISCFECRHCTGISPSEWSCRNYIAAGIGRVLGGDVVSILQRCPGFKPR